MINRTIYCSFLNRKAEGHDIHVYPGRLGEIIFNNISKEAWEQWQSMQTIIINKYKLNMLNIKDRNIVEQKMVAFLFKDQDIHSE